MNPTNTPQCICGPTCENRGHCRIPQHHREGCPVALSVPIAHIDAGEDSQWADHRELLREKPRLGDGATYMVSGLREQSSDRCGNCKAVRWLDQLVRDYFTMRPVCRDGCEASRKLAESRAELVAAIDNAEQVISRRTTCGHDACAGNYTCHLDDKPRRFETRTERVEIPPSDGSLGIPRDVARRWVPGITRHYVNDVEVSPEEFEVMYSVEPRRAR
ncbi:MAG: hypothetical protein M3P06_11565 [Acidobacteriota bacterium]|nr:hypothetical protein [Acidobacteriota bacterium]